MTTISKDLIAATSTPIILAVLNQGESYGYQIIQKVKEASNGHLQFSDGTLYPILRKLEDKGFIVSEWRIAENEKRRRYYNITEQGRDHFKNEQTSWNIMHQLIIQLWNQPKTILA
ncbi:PadR family transcriptional regulator [Mucilaginibacter myungsuensis]|uniref:Helix-turn-helix transcriptional regulator n=1 Tax=Mucilaginibacter myungsuensis TaxID=649104 RepID=A0A929KTG4_9SPHI|nr:PadR family transcriptional regulator [Mucilaginibacter myungsuensis]MBE9660482.1 helix-turn-helix transcriptional regulator [Mucilaginibacter myungsuensis]MDN3600526.1 PadR family transcriptional regulator [Mucilaginibacter myungsuensis]